MAAAINGSEEFIGTLKMTLEATGEQIEGIGGSGD